MKLVEETYFEISATTANLYFWFTSFHIKYQTLYSNYIYLTE